MSTEIIKQPESPLVALSPSDLRASQASLVEWCENKLATMREEITETEQALTTARERHWARKPYERIIAKTKARVTFYAKVVAAIRAGYLVIPDFPIDAFAIRVRSGSSPRADESTASWYTFAHRPHTLPAETGQYVAPEPDRDSETRTIIVNGKEEKRTYFFPTDWREVDFPIQVANPVVLQATQAAMATLIFDELGVVGARRKDPIVVGRVNGPNGKFLQFFIAWWLAPRHLP